MVFKQKDVLVCHQASLRGETAVDINRKRLEHKLEIEGFSVWKEREPKLFLECLKRSRVVIICISRQGELSETYNKNVHAVIKSGKPIALATIEPDYKLPKEAKAAPVEAEPEKEEKVENPDENNEENAEDEKEEAKLPPSFNILHHYPNFTLCGKARAKKNVTRLMEFIKESIRELCSLSKPRGVECHCWICQEVAISEDGVPQPFPISVTNPSPQKTNWFVDSEEEESEEELEVNDSKTLELKDAFFVAASVTSNGMILLADANNENIKVYDVNEGLLFKSSVPLRGIQHMAILPSDFVLVTQRIKHLDHIFSWVSLINEDLTDIRTFDLPSKIKNPNCLAVLRNGHIAITTDAETENSSANIHIVCDEPREMVTSFRVNMSSVISLAASEYSDLIAVSNWRIAEVRMFDYEGNQLWFLIWKDELLLRAPYGMTFASETELMLCEKDLNVVLYLDSKTGDTMREFDNPSAKIVQPQQIISSPATVEAKFIAITDTTPEPKFIRLDTEEKENQVPV